MHTQSAHGATLLPGALPMPSLDVEFLAREAAFLAVGRIFDEQNISSQDDVDLLPAYDA
jgi:hypothetical protein